MTASSRAPGIRQRLYLDGFSMVRPAASIQELPQDAGTAERMADSFTTIDRPYLPFQNPPDKVVKYTWQLGFPRVGTSDYRAFARAEAKPGFVSFALWKPICEFFSGDGESTTFTLLRRNALISAAVLPPNAATIYAVEAYVDDVLVTTPTFGTPDPDKGVTPFTFSAPPAGGSSNIEIFYPPLFYVRVESLSRDFPVDHRETRALTLVEI